MKLAFSLFCKNLWLNLLICAQICAGTVAGIVAVGVISNSYTDYNLTKNSQDAYAYMPESEGVYYTESNLVKYVSSGKIILNRSRNEALMWTYAGDAKTPDEASLNKQYDLNGVFSLGDISSNIIKQQLSKGRWFNESSQDKVIECVVITNDSSLTIGSVLTFGALGVERDENGKIIGKIFTNKYTFKIVGFLKNGSKSLEFTKRTLPAEALRLSDMFETVDYNENNYFKKIGSSIKHDENYYKTPKLTIYCSYKNFFESSLGDYNKGSIGDNAIFKFSENLSQNEKEQILNELKMEAGIVDFKSLRQKEDFGFCLRRPTAALRFRAAAASVIPDGRLTGSLRRLMRIRTPAMTEMSSAFITVLSKTIRN